MRSISILLVLLLMVSCKKETKPEETTTQQYNTAQSYNLTDVSYGPDAQQRMDIYLPSNRSSQNTKVFILIHGGGWSAGSKADFNDAFNFLKARYPQCAIANLEYRLATTSSPAYPKQINDIQLAIQKLKTGNYNISEKYCMFGSSAGGHLAMLYSYSFDPSHHVKAVCNSVGPADFTDPSYINNPLYLYGLSSLVGTQTYQQNPALYAEVSPALKVTATSPKTISFYGDQDPLIPATQGGRLHEKLNQFGVYNEFTLYAGEGHGGWNAVNNLDYLQKIIAFINNHFI